MLRVWSGWGYDYYGDEDSPDSGLMSHETKDLISGSAMEFSHPLISKRPVSRTKSCANKFVARKTDYFSAPIPSDLEVLQKRFNNFSGKYTRLNNVNLPETFSQGGHVTVGSNILV